MALERSLWFEQKNHNSSNSRYRAALRAWGWWRCWWWWSTNSWWWSGTQILSISILWRMHKNFVFCLNLTAKCSFGRILTYSSHKICSPTIRIPLSFTDTANNASHEVTNSIVKQKFHTTVCSIKHFLTILAWRSKWQITAKTTSKTTRRRWWNRRGRRGG